MFNWLDEFFQTIHNSRLRKARLLQESQEKRCESCETLRIQLERSNIEKEKLLNKLFEKPEPVRDDPPVNITPPRQIPWTVRRQMLEAEDREKARLMREAAKPDNDVKDLERELGIKDGERNVTQEGTAEGSSINRA